MVTEADLNWKLEFNGIKVPSPIPALPIAFTLSKYKILDPLPPGSEPVPKTVVVIVPVFEPEGWKVNAACIKPSPGVLVSKKSIQFCFAVVELNTAKLAVK